MPTAVKVWVTQLLANIRQTDAIVHVVRVQEDPKVGHLEARVDPLADIEPIETELIYADLEQSERRLERVAHGQSGDRRAVAEAQSFSQLIEAPPSWSGPLGPCPPSVTNGRTGRSAAPATVPVGGSRRRQRQTWSAGRSTPTTPRRGTRCTFTRHSPSAPGRGRRRLDTRRPGSNVG